MPVRPPSIAVPIFAVALITSSSCLAEPELGEVRQKLGCSGFGCHENSPIVGGIEFYELNRDHLANDQGIRIVDFRSASGVYYDVDVQQARLVGLDPQRQIALDTPGIVGAVLQLEDPHLNRYDVTVVAVGSIPFWAGPSGSATTYELRVRGVRTPRPFDGPLCPMAPDPEAWPGGNVLHAIVFAGDRYSPIDKTVFAVGSATTGWFNIACAGSATAKMHLTRHTEAGLDPQRPTGQPQRQAMLRALTATHCDGAEAATGLGEDLDVADVLGLMPAPAIPPLPGDPAVNVEGVWNEDGAFCRGENRLYQSNSMRQDEANAVMDRIAVQCPDVKSCSDYPDLPDRWMDHGSVLTINP